MNNTLDFSDVLNISPSTNLNPVIVDLEEINRFYSQQLWGKHMLFIFIVFIGEFYNYLRLRFYFRTVMNPGIEKLLVFFDDFFAIYKIFWAMIVLSSLGYTYVVLGIACLFSFPIIIMDLGFYRMWIVNNWRKLIKK